MARSLEDMPPEVANAVAQLHGVVNERFGPEKQVDPMAAALAAGGVDLKNLLTGVTLSGDEFSGRQAGGGKERSNGPDGPAGGI